MCVVRLEILCRHRKKGENFNNTFRSNCFWLQVKKRKREMAIETIRNHFTSPGKYSKKRNTDFSVCSALVNGFRFHVFVSIRHVLRSKCLAF